MGVFYNPPQPIPISQMGYNTQIGGASGGGGGGRKEKRRDLAAEKQDAMAQASKVSGGNPDKYAEVLTSLGYAEDAVSYKDKFAKAEEQNLKVEELEIEQDVEQLRIAADMARSGREDLAVRIANKSIPDIRDQYSSMKYNHKTGEAIYETNSGETGKVNVDALLKAGTKSQVQFQEQAATYRTKLQTMKDPKTLSPTDLLGISMVKRLEIEKDLGQGQSYEEIIKKKPHLELAPLEKEMILKWQQGDLGAVVAAATQANPGMFKTFGAKTPEEAAGIIARIFKSTQDSLRKETAPSAEPRPGGAGAPPQKEGSSTTITESGRTHPAFKTNAKGLLIFKDKEGNEIAVHPNRKDEAISDGLTPVTK